MIPFSFYQDTDVVQIAKKLLGKRLMSCIDGKLTGGFITETEGYAGVEDKASHAYNNRRTARTEIMYADGGVAYVYLCYGIHHLLNVVTGPKDTPHAVLIRALEPCIGKETMFERRKKEPLSAGPGSLTQALGITLKQNGKSFHSTEIWIEEGRTVESIQITPRIGIDYAEEDAFLPYRFIAKLAKIEV